jgi:hypothetical protein
MQMSAARVGEGKGALDFPAVPPAAGAVLNATPNNARDDAASAAGTAAEAVIVALVGVQLVRTAAGPAPAAAHRRYGVEGRLQHLGVVAVRPADGQAERRALDLNADVPLRAQFATIRRVRAGRRSPLSLGQRRYPVRLGSS